MQSALSETRRRVLAGGEQTEEYLITIMEMDETQQKEQDDQNTPLGQTTLDPSPAVSSSPSASSSPCDGTCLVVRLWPVCVFLGARETATGNPGANCRDYHFDQRNGQFRHQLKIEETDDILLGKDARQLTDTTV